MTSTDSTPTPAVELHGVVHRFGEVTALDGLSLVVPTSQVTVLLGPNGAGKTTAIRAITGALSPAVGTILTLGLDPRTHGSEVRPRCGVVSAKPALYDRLSAYDNLLYSAQLYGVDGHDVAERIHAAAARFGIDAALDHQVGGFSTGMKTRLALARAVLHEPELLLFDEPTSGLDPESAYAVLELISQMSTAGHTVVMCTHLLAEAEGLADHIVVMEAGRALVSGTPGELTEQFWPGDLVRLDAESPDQLDRIATWHGVLSYSREPGEPAEARIDSMARVADLVLGLARDGVRLTRVEPHSPTLEDLYFAVRRTANPTGLDSGGLSPVGRGAVPASTERIGASR